jgi:hypothetical protein
MTVLIILTLIAVAFNIGLTLSLKNAKSVSNADEIVTRLETLMNNKSDSNVVLDRIQDMANLVAEKRIDADLADTYVRINWPESQDYMDEKWFCEEAILDTNPNAPSSSYLIPFKRIKQ